MFTCNAGELLPISHASMCVFLLRAFFPVSFAHRHRHLPSGRFLSLLVETCGIINFKWSRVYVQPGCITYHGLQLSSHALAITDMRDFIFLGGGKGDRSGPRAANWIGMKYSFNQNAKNTLQILKCFKRKWKIRKCYPFFSIFCSAEVFFLYKANIS